MRQQIPANRSERTERFQISRAAAVALGLQSFDARDHVKRNEDVAEFSAEPFPALDNRTIHDDSSAKTGADDERNRSRPLAGAEEGKMAPDRRGVGVVEIHHRF